MVQTFQVPIRRGSDFGFFLFIRPSFSVKTFNFWLELHNPNRSSPDLGVWYHRHNQPMWLNSHPSVNCDPLVLPIYASLGKLVTGRLPQSIFSVCFHRDWQSVLSTFVLCQSDRHFRWAWAHVLEADVFPKQHSLSLHSHKPSAKERQVYKLVCSIHGVGGDARYWPSLSSKHLGVPLSWFV